MYSWRLYHALNVFNDSPLTRHPIFKQARRHMRPHDRLFDRMIRTLVVLGSMLLFVLGMWLSKSLNPFMLCLLPFCWFGPLVIVLPAMPVWIVPLSLVVAPTVAQNRLRQMWDLLRITPVETDDLLLTLTRAALERLRSLLGWLLPALIPLSMIVGTAFAEAVFPPVKRIGRVQNTTQTVHVFIWSLLWGIGALLIIVDRMQQLLMMSMGALTGGAFSGKSTRSAVISGAVWALSLWIAEIGITALVVLIMPGARSDQASDILLSILVGPLPSYLVALPVGAALLALGITLLLREAIIGLLWRSVLYAIRE